MMQSTLQRRRAAYDFSQCYEDFCCSHGACPLSMVTNRIKETALVCSGERIRPTDWIPLCRALQMNKSLEAVQLAFDPSRDQLTKGTRRRGQSAPAGVRPGTAGYLVAASRMDRSAVTCLISRSLGGVIRVSPALETLSLEGILLRFDDITLLAKGFTKLSRLQNLSLAQCRIGDSGAEVLCTALQASRCVRHLDLSFCSLTWRTAVVLAKLIEHHANWRYAHLWQTSLRQVRANTDGVGGLRRLTLSANPLFGDRGVSRLMDTLQDDIWIKAVDIQHCGLSNIGVRLWLGLLRSGNLTLMVVDLRQNVLADKPLIRAVMEQIVINGHGINDDPEYLWRSSVVSATVDGLQEAKASGSSSSPLRSQQHRPHQSRGSSKPKLPVGTGSHGRSRSAETQRPRHQKKRSCSASSRARIAGDEEEVVVIQPVRGLPWRTAARSALRKRRARSGDSAPVNLHFSPNSLSSASNSGEEDQPDAPHPDADSSRQPIAAAPKSFPSQSEAWHRASASHHRHVAAPQARPPQRGTTPAQQPDEHGHGSRQSSRRRRSHSRRELEGGRHPPGRVEERASTGKRHGHRPDDRPSSADDASDRTFTLPSPSLRNPQATTSTAGEWQGTVPAPCDVRSPSQSPILLPAVDDGFGEHRHGRRTRETGMQDDQRSRTRSKKSHRSRPPVQLTNPNLAGLQEGTSLDDQLLERFETALNQFSQYLAVMKQHSTQHPVP